MDPFLALLNSFSASLSPCELGDLKFLCQDKISKGRLESVQSGRELFTILLERQVITRSNVTYLEELFKNIKREDLLSRLQYLAEEGEVSAAGGDQPDADEKRRWIIFLIPTPQPPSNPSKAVHTAVGTLRANAGHCCPQLPLSPLKVLPRLTAPRSCAVPWK